MAEKLIARAAGKDTVRPGETVTVTIDLAIMHDSSGPRRIAPILERLGAKIWDPAKIVLISDHRVPAVDPQSASILDITRRWARENNIKAFYDMAGVLVTGETWIRVPESIRIEWTGKLRPGVCAKDINLALCAHLGLGSACVP